MNKKLSDMSSDQRIAYWVHRHTLNVVGDIGSKRSVASADRLIEKLCDEMRSQREVAIEEYIKQSDPQT